VDDSWAPSSPGSDLVNDKSPFDSPQFTDSWVENALLVIDSSKVPGPDGIPPLILRNCTSGFAFPLCMLFNRSLTTCIFPDRWKLLFITPIFKSGKRNDISNYRGIAILSAIARLFELLVYRVINEDLMGRFANCRYGFVNVRSTVSYLLENFSFVLKTIEDGCQVDLIYMDFLKAFNRVRHCPLSVVAFLLFWLNPAHKNRRLCFEINVGYFGCSSRQSFGATLLHLVCK
jgi:hypothetical protein